MLALENPTPRRRPGVLAAIVAGIALLVAALGASPAMADFGLKDFHLAFRNQDGSLATQAGSHPYQLTFSMHMNTVGSGFAANPDGNTKDILIEQIAGFLGNPEATPKCSTVDFSQIYGAKNGCPNSTVIGVAGTEIFFPTHFLQASPVFNLERPRGDAARLGFIALSVPVIVDVTLKGDGEYNVDSRVANVFNTVKFYGSHVTLWGRPTDPSHDELRGSCIGPYAFGIETSHGEEASYSSEGSCPVTPSNVPFLTMPGRCEGSMATNYAADSWQNPGIWVPGSFLLQDDSEPPQPIGMSGCGKLNFSPRTESEPTTYRAESGTGLNFNVDFNQEGLLSYEGLAQSEVKKAEVTLPEGVTINPSVGEGLGVCTPADIARESLAGAPGEGCPSSSEVGTLDLETPVIDQPIEGTVYLAEEDNPETTEHGAENPFDSLIALYLVLKNPDLGALVKLPMKVEPDPTTGRLVATLEGVPQVPFSHFNFHFKEGVRSALVTPATCGQYTTEAKFWPWSNPSEPLTTTSSFEITHGKDGGACPPGGVPPFNPKFEAGSVNNNAGSYSPFDMRLTREDGEQDMTKFSATLPPGVLGKLSGVEKCGPYAVAVAKEKTGRQELANPSCPANSEIGTTLAGAGVGSALTYVKGKIYLGGPYHGDPLSVIAITPALAGPFDAGTVAVQEALTLNPKTAEVEVDGARSDPIPHILKGIVLKIRELRVNVDRPDFTLNPTNCDESSARSVLFGSYINVLDPSDDRPVDLSTRYQAANCLNLGFKPDLRLKLQGGTRRGGHPGLRAIYTPKSGDANIKGLVVRLPRSAFLDQGHIRTICTRVQYAAGGGNGEKCPKAARYGYVKAWTPLLDEPLQGPVYLRSSNHKLPDMVLALHGLVDVEVGIRIDSARGGIRATMEDAPDATLSRVLLRMQGAKKGLIVNSRNLCAHKSRANDIATGQNGKQFHTHPVVRVQCRGKRKAKRHGHHRRAKRAQVAHGSAVR